MNNNTKDFQEQFLDELLIKVGFEDTDLDLLKEDLRPILQERIMLNIYRETNETQQAMISNFLENWEYDKMTNHLQSIIPNFDDFLMEIYAQFEDEYLENMKN